jgi:hypothetical protein
LSSVAGGRRLPQAFWIDLLLLEAVLASVVLFGVLGAPAVRRRLPRPTLPALPHQVVEAGVFVAILAAEVRSRVSKR